MGNHGICLLVYLWTDGPEQKNTFLRAYREFYFILPSALSPPLILNLQGLCNQTSHK